jgi:hypothetical protein
VNSTDDARLLLEARQRAEAYARQRPDDDVPAGWILEEASVPGTYHFRTARPGSKYGPAYKTRQEALTALLNTEKPAAPLRGGGLC